MGNNRLKQGRHAIAIFLFLLGAAMLPALVQLFFQGWTPPGSHPFSITAQNATAIAGGTVWVDARTEDSFQAAHVPDALSLNRLNWDVGLPRLFAAFHPGETIIVYCAPDCSESEHIASRLREVGFSPVFFLEGGFESWRKLHRSRS